MGKIIASRRGFLKISAVSGAFMLSCNASVLAKMVNNEERLLIPDNLKGDIGLFIKIDAENNIEIGYPVPDMGQGVSTALSMIIADELDADFDKVTVVKLKTHSVDVERRGQMRLGDGGVRQVAGGSQAIAQLWTIVRTAGASARRQILRAAALKLKISIDDLTASKSYVVVKSSGKKYPYGDFAMIAAKLPDTKDIVALKDIKDFTIIGTEQKVKDAPNIVRGKALFGMDMSMTGVDGKPMLHAVVARCPYVNGSVKSYDGSKALKVDGVVKIIPQKRLPENMKRNKLIDAGVAVVATSHWAALKGREALIIEWNKGDFPDLDNDSISKDFDLIQKGEMGKSEVHYESGDAAGAMKDAATTLTADYNNPYWAHATMEVPNAIVYVQGDGAKVIMGQQAPVGLKSSLGRELGLDAHKVDVSLCWIGGGFGRKFTSDVAVEAGLLSKATGRPVQVMWTREDDLCHDYYNPMGRHVMQAGFNKDNDLTAMTYHSIGGSARNSAENFPALYVDNYLCRSTRLSRLPTGAWRGPGHNVSGLALQCFTDEIAHKKGVDPLEFRLSLLKGKGDLPHNGYGSEIYSTRRVEALLKKAAKEAGWGRKLPKGHGMGIASFFTFGGYCAIVVEVKVDGDGLHIIKATGAVDCGVAVNPLGIAAQMESGILDAFSATLGQEVIIKDGRVITDNFDTYDMARIAMLKTKIDTHIMPSDAHPNGLGEIALPAAIPALLNAIFDATGQRIRNIPIGDQLNNI